MTLSLLFWILMLLALLGVGVNYRARPQEGWPVGIALLLLIVLGWAVFGAPIH
jgi:hypothetical protein